MSLQKFVRIEFDSEKNAANLAMHGVDMVRAEEMDFAKAMVIEDKRREYGEPRWLAYAPIDGRLHVCVTPAVAASCGSVD